MALRAEGDVQVEILPILRRVPVKAGRRLETTPLYLPPAPEEKLREALRLMLRIPCVADAGPDMKSEGRSCGRASSPRRSQRRRREAD